MTAHTRKAIRHDVALARYLNRSALEWKRAGMIGVALQCKAGRDASMSSARRTRSQP